MKGLELSKAYFSEAIRPILAKRVTEIGQSYAAALLGWGPRCLLFLPDPLIRHKAKILNELNRHLPVEFRGHPTRFVTDPENPTVRIPAGDSVGQVHVEVTTCNDYLTQNIGTVVPKNEIEWLTIPESGLLGLTRGEVFWDGFGDLTRYRRYYQYFPLNVWKYRLAYAWQALGWDIDLIGLCAVRGDVLSARHSVSVSAYRIMALVFLSSEIGPILEDSYCTDDLALIPERLTAACDLLVEHQERMGLLPSSADIPHRSYRGFVYADCQAIADQIKDSIEGELGALTVDGALDQWVGNYDLLVRGVGKLKSLSPVYDSPHKYSSAG